MSYDDYFGRNRDEYHLVRVKRAWVPEWLWWMAARIDSGGSWLAYWLTEDVADG